MPGLLSARYFDPVFAKRILDEQHIGNIALKIDVEEGVRQEDKLCVICQDRPKAPVQVRAVGLGNLRVVQTEQHISLYSKNRDEVVAVAAVIVFFFP